MVEDPTLKGETIEDHEPSDILELPVPGGIEYEGITVFNNPSESTLPPVQETEKETASAEVPPSPVKT